MNTQYCCHCGTVFEEGDEDFKECCDACHENWWTKEFNNLCPPLYRELDLKKLPGVPTEAWNRAAAWKLGPEGLLLVGKTRAGKTRIMWQVIKKILKENRQRPRIMAFTCVSFGHELARAYKSGSAEEWLDSVYDASVVFFDDLGKEKLTDRAQAELFGVIDHRMSHLKPILATTEHTPDGLSSRMSDERGPAMINRLRESCSMVPVP